MIQKKKEDKEEEKWDKKVWLNKDGIICLGTTAVATEESIDEVLDQIVELLKKFEGKGRVLVRTSPYIGALSKAGPRKRFAQRAKKVFKEIGFKKVAIFGGDIAARIITLFIITASGIKDIKVFAKKEKALKWLREP